VKLARFWITLATSVSFLEVFSSGYSAVKLTQCQFMSDIIEHNSEFKSNIMVFKSDIIVFKSDIMVFRRYITVFKSEFKSDLSWCLRVTSWCL